MKELNWGLVEDLALALEQYSLTLHAIVELYLSDKRIDPSKVDVGKFADLVDYHLARLEDELKKVDDHIQELRESLLEGCGGQAEKSGKNRKFCAEVINIA